MDGFGCAGVGLLHHHEKAGALFSAAGSIVRVQQLSGKGSKSQGI